MEAQPRQGAAMKPYSEDLRRRVLPDCDAGMKARPAAQKYTAGESWARRLKQRRRETGEVAPRGQRHGPPPGREARGCAEALRAAVASTPDAAPEELQARLGLA